MPLIEASASRVVRRAGLLAIAIRNGDKVASLDQRPRDPEPDPLRSPRDDGDWALLVSAH